MFLASAWIAGLNGRTRWLAGLAAGLLYLAAFTLLRPALGPEVTILSVVPIIVVAGLLGFWPGVVVGALLIPVNSLLLAVPGESLAALIWRYRLGHVAGLLVGAVVGLLSDVSRRFRAQSLELVREIAERRRAEAALRDIQTTLEERVFERTAALQASEARFQLFMQHFPGLAYIKDAEARVLFANQGFETLLRLQPAEITGKTNAEIFPPEFAEAMTAADRRILEQGESLEVEEAYGGRTWVTHKFAIRQAGHPPLLGGFTLDVTERKAAENRLRESEERFRRFSDVATEGILFHQAGRIVDANRAMAAMFGYELPELLTRPLLDLVAPEARALVTHQVSQGFAGLYEAAGLRRDGTIFPVEVRAQSFTVRGETLRVACLRDITERRQASQALQAAKDRLERILASLQDGFFILDHDGRYTYVNAEAAASGFTTPEALLGRCIWELAPGLVGGPFYEACQRARDEGQASTQTDVFFDYGPQGTKWYNLTVYPFEEGVAVHYRDISDRKRMELALRDNEYFLSRSQEVGDLGSYYLDVQAGTWISSPKLDDIFGIDAAYPRTVAGWLALLPSEERAELAAYLQQHVLAEHHRFDREYRIVRPSDGQARWMHGLGELEFDAAGQPVKMIGTIQDISRRKQTELALRNQEYFLTRSQEVGDLGSYYFDTRAGTWISSPKLDEILGIDAVYPKTVASWLRLVHPDHRAEMEQHLLQHVLADHHRFDREYRIVRPSDGQARWMHGLGELEFDAAGRPIKMIGTIQDVTRRRLADQALAESERRFRETLELSPLYAVAVDANGRITFSNHRLAEAIGWAPEALVGQNWYQQFMPPDLDLRADVAEYVRQGGFPPSFERDLVLPSGERRQVLWTNTNLRGPAGELAGVTSLGLDVTEARRLEQALSDSEAQLRLFYELPFIGMAITSAKTKQWLRVNQRLAEILGYPREVLVQKTWAEMTHPDDLAQDLAAFEQVVNGAREGYQLDKRFIRPDGGIVFATIDVRCVRALDGTVDYFVATVQDIGDRKRTEAELERRVAERTAQLETANRELEAFAYSVSHDLRAPLRAIDGFSLALLEDYGAGLAAPAQDHLQRVRQGAQQMGQLIDALLLLSRVTRQEMRRQAVDLSAAARGVIQDLRAAEPGRSVEVTIAPGLSATGDPRLLGVVLSNLLGNAWKFTRRRPLARLEFGVVPAERAFFVRDNGVGFDPAYTARLFEPFARLHSPAEFEGTGIGLATVQRIVQRHGGRVWAESQPMAGAVFWFTLPE